jgi:hypothetical protein
MDFEVKIGYPIPVIHARVDGTGSSSIAPTVDE